MGLFDGLPAMFTEAIGDPVTYTPAGGDPVTINAIVEWDSIIESPLDAKTNVQRVVAHVRGEDVAASPAGGTIGVAETDWSPARVWKIVQPINSDGKGMTMLTLERVP